MNNNNTHGDWSDSGQKPKGYTRDETVIKLIERIERLTDLLIIAQTALEVLNNSGNAVAKAAIEEIKKRRELSK